MTKFEKIISFVSAAVFLLIAVFVYNGIHQAKLGQALPQTPANFETSLAVPQATADTTMTLASGTLGNGSLLSGYYCFTLDSNTAISEYECGTASGTAVSNLTRGVDPVNGTSSVPSLIFSHRVGADVRITDYPALSLMQQVLNGSASVPNALYYDPSVASSSMIGVLQDLASVAYVNAVAKSGASNASTSVNGLVQFATPTQTSAGTLQGSSGAFLVPQNGIFAYTPSSATSVPVSNTSGFINQSYLNLSQAFVFTGALTDIGATTTLIATTTKPLVLDTVPYVWPNTQGTANAILTNDGSGNLSWSAGFKYLNASTSPSSIVVNGGGSGSSSTTIVSLPITLAAASRISVAISDVTASVTSVGGSGQGCTFGLYIDNVSVTNFNSFLVSASYFLSPQFISSQLAAGSHTIVFTTTANLSGGSSVTCTVHPDSMYVINIGN